MANRRFPDMGTNPENGMIGGVQGYGSEGREGTSGREFGEREEEGARYYRAAMHRPSEEREGERTRGAGERGGRSGQEQSFDRGGEWGGRPEGWRSDQRSGREEEWRDQRSGRGEDWRGGEQRTGRGEEWRRGEQRFGRGEEWRGGEQRSGRGEDWRGGERWGRDEGWRGGGQEGRGGERFERGRAGFEDFGTPSYGQGREIRERYADRDFEGRDERYAGRSGAAYYGGEAGREQRRGRGLWEREPALARDIMTANPKAVRREASLRDVAQIMRDENCGVVPVCDENQKLIGLITDRDVVMRTIDTNRPWTECKVHEVMTDEVEAVTPDTSVRDIIQLMGKKQIRRVPVVDAHDRLLGMIAMADVATRANEDEELQEALDRISKRRSFWSRLWQ
ncbi:MAG TPA: CBS domain-containing protein [Myxococcaceae bacterium]|nr:CBS domain-containing protein [Myxococcaceae bacterium]